MTAPRRPVPLERHEQATVYAWSVAMRPRVPELGLLYAIPNGGHRHKAVAAKLAAEGVRSGVPDLCLPVMRQQRAGLYVEMKRVSGSTTSAEQKAWHAALRAQGYRVDVCKGAREAAACLLDYLGVRDARIPLPEG